MIDRNLKVNASPTGRGGRRGARETPVGSASFAEFPSLRAARSVCKVLIPPWQVVRAPAEQPPTPRWAPAGSSPLLLSG